MLFENLSFVAEPGGYIELRGANGAGKTSLLRAIAGFLKPSAGSINFDNVPEPALAMHLVGHVNGLKREASVRSHLRYWAGLFGGAHDEGSVLASVGLEGLAERPTRTLSQGQARRLALARVVLAPRPIWLLDEPASALDDNGRTLVADLIGAHRASGGIAIAALHELLGPTPTQTVALS